MQLRATQSRRPNRWLLIQAGRFVDEPWSERITDSYRVNPIHVVAFSTWPGEGCEPANFGLCRFPAFIEIENPIGRGRKKRLDTKLGSGWHWGSFCKTQYASNPECGGVAHFLRCHLLVIKTLDHAQELGILGEVNDEGEFWEKRDVAALAREVGEWNPTIAQQAEQFKDLLGMEFQTAIAEFPNAEHLEARMRWPWQPVSFCVPPL